MPGDTAQLVAPNGGRASAAAPSRRAKSVDESLDSDSDPAARPNSLSRLWQAPVILLSGALIVIGIRTAIQPKSGPSFEQALAKAEAFIEAGQLDDAQTQIRLVVEPALDAATAQQQARFSLVVADFMLMQQQSRAPLDPASSKHAAEHYAKAVALGAKLSPAQIESWVDASLAVGNLKSAMQRLAELEAIQPADASTRPDQPPADTGFAATRNRVFRSIIEYSLTHEDVEYGSLMQTLADYRLQPAGLSAADEAWAIARQAELRLEFDSPGAALESLLVDMRRLESRHGAAHGSAAGELYALLGRCYYEVGEYQNAKAQLQHGLSLLDSASPVRGDAYVLLAHIAQAAGDQQTAFEHFHTVAREFVATRSYLPGLLGRAEVQSMLGDHEASQRDYAALRDLLGKIPPRRDVTALDVAASLCDRHDAALTLAQLDRALEYVSIAEGLFPSERVPLDVLFRLASTNRQIADNLVATIAARRSDASPALALEQDDPALRREANVRYERAGEYFLLHAMGESSGPRADDDWTTSIWLAADSFDRGGRHARAAREFARYLDASSLDDPRRAETLYRLGQCHQAQLDYQAAAAFYERVVENHARSNFAAQSYVPLAQCLAQTARVPEARQLLGRVLSGDGLLQPDAVEYRNALIDLGRLEYEQGQFTAAIERFEQAAQRYLNDARRMDVLFLLGNSYRGNAEAIAAQARQGVSMSPAEAGRLNALRTQQLDRAQETFAKVSNEFGAVESQLNATQRDMLRRARLYEADCAFDLGHMEAAVQLYEQVARQYSSHQSSMYALVQIVNCYSVMNDAERAAAAHHRALVRLKQLPDHAFSASDALMDRAAWERWLQNSPIAPLTTASAASSSG